MVTISHLLDIDDIQSARKMEEISVECFKGFTKQTIGKGTLKPLSSLLVTSNQHFAGKNFFIVFAVFEGFNLEGMYRG